MRVSDEDLAWVVNRVGGGETIAIKDIEDVALDLRDLRAAAGRVLECLTDSKRHRCTDCRAALSKALEPTTTKR